MKGLRLGYALCGSFCTFEQSLAALEKLVKRGATVLPVLSYHAAGLDTRFGTARELKERLFSLTGCPPVQTIQGAEPIGPKALCDLMVVAPCTGNTLAQLALGITDTPVTMACKSHLRSGRPVLLALSTNDALAAGGQNLGRLLNTKNIFFVPMRQDAPGEKPASLTADYALLEPAITAALAGRQLQPVFLG